MVQSISESIGGLFLELSESAGQLAFLVRSTVVWMFRSSIEWKQILTQMVRIGVESVGVSTATALFTGMVLALETSSSFKDLFNEPLFTGTIVAFAIIKELGPVMTAVVVAGRAGAAIAAELGTMKVTEQIDALYTLGTDPIRFLVIPRVVAFIIVLPLLTVFADFAGVIGGGFVAHYKYEIPVVVYWHDIFDHMENKQLFHGLIKTIVFALCIAFISCQKGLSTRGGAEGVGKATTAAVVESMAAVLIVDYFLTAVLVSLGLT
ncbi:MAG: ABC transporter permease [Elusimicrobia bacterium]|nr:ABC transporter permease [Elusimicrobiota bacterium]